MNVELFDNTKLTAYFLWEHTGCDNALNLWYCAEDLACYFEQTDILSVAQVEAIKHKSLYDLEYIAFVRHLAYRIYVYTNRTDDRANWFAAERLLTIGEWVGALTNMSTIYRKEKANHSIMSGVRSENVRAYYDEQTFYKP